MHIGALEPTRVKECGSCQSGVWSTKSFSMLQPTTTTMAPNSHSLLGREKRNQCLWFT